MHARKIEGIPEDGPGGAHFQACAEQAAAHGAHRHIQDFGDLESQRVSASAALAVARELGAQAAREYFAELMEQKDSR